jgi:hypothetical protein
MRRRSRKDLVTISLLFIVVIFPNVLARSRMINNYSSA